MIRTRERSGGDVRSLVVEITRLKELSKEKDRGRNVEVRGRKRLSYSVAPF